MWVLYLGCEVTAVVIRADAPSSGPRWVSRPAIFIIPALGYAVPMFQFPEVSFNQLQVPGMDNITLLRCVCGFHSDVVTALYATICTSDDIPTRSDRCEGHTVINWVELPGAQLTSPGPGSLTSESLGARKPAHIFE